MRYKEYKKIDLPWVEEVPSHWDCIRLKQVAKDFYSGGTPSAGSSEYYCDDGQNYFLNISDMSNSRYVTKVKKKLTKKGIEEKNLQLQHKFKIVYAMYASVGKVALLNLDLYISQAFLAFKIRNEYIDNYMLYQLSNLERYVDYYTKASTQKNLNADIVKNFIMLVPPKKEQEQIARFLDWKINEIDRLIEIKKKNIITLDKFLNESIKKTLNNYNRKTTRLKNIAKSNLLNLNGNEEIDTINYLEISDVGTGFLRKSPENIIFRDAPSRARRIVNENNIIISTVRTYLKSIYKIKSREKDCIVSTGFSVLEIDPKHNIDYIYFVLLSDEFLDNVQRVSYGVSYPAISDSQLMNLKLSIVEDRGKQDEIVEKLFRLQKTVDKNIKNIQSQINNLQQLKKSLISEVVTGKIDVRNVIIPEYDKVSDIEDDVTLDGNFNEEV